MTEKQKAARAKFKMAIAETKKIRAKNPKLTQAQALKQAFAILYSKDNKVKKVGVVKKAATKKAPLKKVTSSHKDTKSHNVNIRVVSGFVGRLIVKAFTLAELKKMNPVFFEKGKDKSAGIYKRKLIVSKKLESQVMIEAKKDLFTGIRSYSVRLINPEGSISTPKKFDSIFEAANYIGKNIVL